MNVKKVRLADIRPWPKNPRKVKEEDMARLKKQLAELEQHAPLLVNKNGIILGGNMRYKAMLELGWSECYVVEVDADTETKMLEYALSHNDAVGVYDERLLMEVVNEAGEFDFSKFRVEFAGGMELKDFIAQGPVAYPEKDLTQGVETANSCPKCGYRW